MLSDHTSIELWSVKLVVEFGLDNSRVQVSKFNLKFRVEVTWITRTHNFLSIWKAYTAIYDIYEIQFIPNSRIIWTYMKSNVLYQIREYTSLIIWTYMISYVYQIQEFLIRR